MGLIPKVATVFFVVSIPLLLITTNIRWAASEARLYQYSFGRYDAEERTGIARSELDQAADELVAYFHSDEKNIDIRVEQDGQQVPLFNERETAHLADVKDLFRANFRVQEAALAFAFVYVAAVFVWAAEASLRVLARILLTASLLTLGLLVLFGVGALVGFDEIFLRFHFLAFTNDLWKLNPTTDHLIQMFPRDFWFDATMLVVGLTALEATALASLSAAYLKLRLQIGAQPLAAEQPRA